MFALVQDGSITEYFSGNRGVTIDSIQHPKAIFTLWTKSEREAIGIYEVEIDNTNKLLMNNLEWIKQDQINGGRMGCTPSKNNNYTNCEYCFFVDFEKQ